MINPNKECTLCQACVQACPQKCISIGLLDRIEINKATCVNCGACVRVCQITHAPKFHSPSYIYAAYNKNRQELMRSSSGGIGGILLRTCLSEGFKVFSAINNDEVVPIIEEIQFSNIDGALRSKYCFSDVNNSYVKCRDYLRNGEKVLFLALPCQIGGLKLFLKEYNNLYCVDLFCHGAPSAIELRKHLNYKNTKRKKVVDLQFRDKSISQWGNYCFGYYYSDGSDSKGPALCDYYFSNFINGSFFRECCYQCGYAKFDRVGDISIGDYWHITPRKLDASTNGISAVLINDVKGVYLWQLIKNSCEYETGTKESVQRATHAVLSPMQLTKAYMTHADLTQEQYNEIAKKYEKNMTQVLRLLRWKIGL